MEEELIKIKLKDKDEQFQIAFILRPAIKDDWTKFNEQEYQFKVSDQARQIISGYAMIADLEIGRIDQAGKPFKVKFSKEAICEIVMNFFREGLVKNFNENHQTGQLSEGVFLFESMFIDSSRGINPPEGFSKQPDGSWFISVKVENPEIWKKIEANEYRGFSIESKRFVEDDEDYVERFLETLK